MTEDRAARLAALAAQIRDCKACRLYEKANKAVPGSGTPLAEILFIGEGPGFNEDKQGLPFVGASGHYLDELLALIGLKRDAVFIANVVKHRPPDNRDPLPDEIEACRRYLDDQEAIIDPLLVVTLGRFSMARYFPGGKITQIHGKPRFDARRAYLPLFHPAAVLRNPGLRLDMETDVKSIPGILERVRKIRAEAAASAPPADSNPPEDPPTQLKLF